MDSGQPPSKELPILPGQASPARGFASVLMRGWAYQVQNRTRF
jgi:hypothetical protein